MNGFHGLSTEEQRYVVALWYAWGRQDEARVARVDVFAFADHHKAQAHAYTTGEITWLPSVQDAYDTYVASLVCDGGGVA